MLPSKVSLLQLLTDEQAKGALHEALFYDPETGASYVSPKRGDLTPLHSWRGVYPTAEAALVAAGEAGLDPTAIYYSFSD